MSPRRLLAGLAAAAVLATPVSWAAVSHAAEPASVDHDPVLPRRSHTLSTTVLPKVAQNGKAAASADAAKAVVSVKVSPAPASGSRVTILRSVSGADSFTPIGTAVVDKSGAATYLTDVSYGLNTFDFQAQLGADLSNVAAGAPWASPDFSEEFSGGSIPSGWSHRGTDYNPSGARYCSKGDPHAAKFSGGVATLSVLKDPGRSTLCPTRLRGKVVGSYAYRLNGHISTEQSYSFTYGIAAARMKFGKAEGQHGGFWMQPVGNHPAGAEIDVVEWFGENKAGGVTSFTYHRDAAGQPVKTGDWIKNSQSFLAGKSDAWYKRYHVFSVQWTPHEYIFRIDGRETWRSSVGVSHVPEFLILSLLSSDYEIPKLGDARLPQSMSVDWVRVWQA